MFFLASELAPIVFPGVATFDGVRAPAREPLLDGPLAEVERAVRARPPADLADVRAMYRAVGLDPTKRRPSSEALLRRVLRGEPLPRINALVDICNWCSLEFQLPYGLYDLDRVEGDVTLRLGQPGEQYPGIRKDVVHVEGRLTLADATGPFGNPSSDSARTMVTDATSRVMVVVFAPRRVTRDALAGVLAQTSSRVLAYAGGRETSRVLVSEAEG